MFTVRYRLNSSVLPTLNFFIIVHVPERQTFRTLFSFSIGQHCSWKYFKVVFIFHTSKQWVKCLKCVSSSCVPTSYICLQHYLVQFGYMDPQAMKNVSIMTDNMMKTSVMEFQMFVGLEPTGKHSCSCSVHRSCWLTKTCWYLLWSIWILCRTLWDSVVGIATCYGLDSPGIESWWGARFSAPIQTGPGAHPASCTTDTRSFPGVKAAGAWR